MNGSVTTSGRVRPEACQHLGDLRHRAAADQHEPRRNERARSSRPPAAPARAARHTAPAAWRRAAAAACASSIASASRQLLGAMAGGQCAGSIGAQRRVLDPAAVDHERAAGVEAAARRDVGRARHVAAGHLPRQLAVRIGPRNRRQQHARVGVPRVGEHARPSARSRRCGRGTSPPPGRRRASPPPGRGR